MFTFLLIVQTVIAASLVAVILMQRSEGGGLGVGGSSSGLMTARGASDFLTRSTSILGALFVGLSIVLAAVAGSSREPATIDTSLANTVAPAPVAPTVPLAGQAANETAPAPANHAAPAENQPAPVPLAQ
ncbi:MAG TPA: preprotein translocase subunit SecG [Sphingomicrobium sp.]|nr:preprotein translocase subunit SecG [Sphingomicrobium sp.]